MSDSWEKDSDTVFNVVSEAARTIDEAKQMVAVFYLPDMEFSRAGISHALKRLERHYQQQEKAS